MIMKSIILAITLAVATCRPSDLAHLEGDHHHEHHHEHEPVVNIVSQDFSAVYGYNFRAAFEADNGVSQTMTGAESENGGQEIVGGYKLTLPDGSVMEIEYVAGEQGFIVSSPTGHLPVAPAFEHPIPEHAQQQIDFALSQRNAG